MFRIDVGDLLTLLWGTHKTTTFNPRTIREMYFNGTRYDSFFYVIVTVWTHHNDVCLGVMYAECPVFYGLLSSRWIADVLNLQMHFPFRGNYMSSSHHINRFCISEKSVE